MCLADKFVNVSHLFYITAVASSAVGTPPHPPGDDVKSYQLKWDVGLGRQTVKQTTLSSNSQLNRT